MTAPETLLDSPSTGSAYPPDVESLMPDARTMTTDSGEIPSRNRLMKELKIGAPKANAVRDRLRSESPDLPVSTGAPIFDPFTQVTASADPGATPKPRKPRAWPVAILATPAFVAVWSGWVGLGALTGFGVIHPLPGIADGFSLNTAITLPIGVEVYAAYAIRIWLSPAVSARARRFAKWSVIAALVLGALGQIAYHLMAAAHMTAAPWQITTGVATMPILVVFAGSALAHLVHTDEPTEPAPVSA